MKMNSFGYTKDIVTKDTKTPALLMHYYPGEKPDILIPINGDIWVCKFDEFFDAGFEDGFGNNVIFIPICGHDCKPRTTARMAFNYFMNGADSGEYGEPTMHNEADHRRTYFAALYKMKTGHDIIFKAKEV